MGLLGDIFDTVGDAANVIQTSVGAVLGIVTEVHKQVDAVDTLVSQPLRAVAEKIQAGQIWRGPNADDFLGVLREDFLVNAVSASDGLKVFGTALADAQKAVADADMEAARFAEEIFSDASSIMTQLQQSLSSK